MWFQEAVAAYLTARQPRKDSPHTTAAYRADLTTVAGILADQHGCAPEELRVDMLTLPAMRCAFAEYAHPRARTTIRRCWSTWNGLLDHLVSEGHLDGNPMAGVARPHNPRRQPRAFTSADTDRLLSALVAGMRTGRDPWPERDLAVVVTLLVTGIRSQELLDLNVGDLTGTTRSLRLRVRGKGDADRAVPVEPGLSEVVNAYLDSRRSRFPRQASRRGLPHTAQPLDRFPAQAPLFVGRDGARLRRGGLQYLVRSAYRAAGVESVRERGALVHALRHTFATRLVENPDTTVVQLMDLLGHKSLATTQRYVHASSREVRATAARNPTYATLQNLNQPR